MKTCNVFSSLGTQIAAKMVHMSLAHTSQTASRKKLNQTLKLAHFLSHQQA